MLFSAIFSFTEIGQGTIGTQSALAVVVRFLAGLGAKFALDCADKG